MAGSKTLNLSRKSLSSAVSAFSPCVARTTAQRRPGLTSGSNRSLRSLGPAKAGPLANRYVQAAKNCLNPLIAT